MFEKKKTTYIVHESRKSYVERRNRRFTFGLFAFVLLIYFATKSFVFFISLLVIGLAAGVTWKLLKDKSKKKSK